LPGATTSQRAMAHSEVPYLVEVDACTTSNNDPFIIPVALATQGERTVAVTIPGGWRDRLAGTPGCSGVLQVHCMIDDSTYRPVALLPNICLTSLPATITLTVPSSHCGPASGAMLTIHLLVDSKPTGHGSGSYILGSLPLLVLPLEECEEVSVSTHWQRSHTAWHVENCWTWRLGGQMFGSQIEGNQCWHCIDEVVLLSHAMMGIFQPAFGHALHARRCAPSLRRWWLLQAQCPMHIIHTGRLLPETSQLSCSINWTTSR